MPPTGRAAKPTQKVAKADNWAASGESFGEKNRGPKTKAAAVPYRKKSYHSMDVPIKLAIATRTIGDFLVDSWVSLMITSYHDSHGGCRVLQLHQMYVARKIEILHRYVWLTACTRKETIAHGVRPGIPARILSRSVSGFPCEQCSALLMLLSPSQEGENCFVRHLRLLRCRF